MSVRSGKKWTISRRNTDNVAASVGSAYSRIKKLYTYIYISTG